MTMREFCEKIGMDEASIQQVEQFSIEDTVYTSYKREFQEDKKRFFARLKEEENWHVFALVLYIRMAVEVYETFQEKGIADQVYFDTFSDFRIWNEECKKKYGICGLTECEWLSLPLELKIFRLGRLQFEPICLEKAIETEKYTLPEGTKVLNVHIPEDGRLDIETCMDAFERAENFFQETFEAFVCESWLVSPKLKELLGEDSNIIKFMGLFENYGIVYPFRQAEQRVFGGIREQKEEYPEHTSLQRALKKYVLNGKEPGMGQGVRLRAEKRN